MRIGFYRVGMLASGVVLMAVRLDFGWRGAFVLRGRDLPRARGVPASPRRAERKIVVATRVGSRAELAAIARSPFALAVLAAFALGVVWLVDGATRWSSRVPGFWALRGGGRGARSVALASFAGRTSPPPSRERRRRRRCR